MWVEGLLRPLTSSRNTSYSPQRKPMDMAGSEGNTGIDNGLSNVELNLGVYRRSKCLYCTLPPTNSLRIQLEDDILGVDMRLWGSETKLQLVDSSEHWETWLASRIIDRSFSEDDVGRDPDLAYLPKAEMANLGCSASHNQHRPNHTAEGAVGIDHTEDSLRISVWLRLPKSQASRVLSAWWDQLSIILSFAAQEARLRPQRLDSTVPTLLNKFRSEIRVPRVNVRPTVPNHQDAEVLEWAITRFGATFVAQAVTMFCLWQGRDLELWRPNPSTGRVVRTIILGENSKSTEPFVALLVALTRPPEPPLKDPNDSEAELKSMRGEEIESVISTSPVVPSRGGWSIPNHEPSLARAPVTASPCITRSASSADLLLRHANRESLSQRGSYSLSRSSISLSSLWHSDRPSSSVSTSASTNTYSSSGGWLGKRTVLIPEPPEDILVKTGSPNSAIGGFSVDLITSMALHACPAPALSLLPDVMLSDAHSMNLSVHSIIICLQTHTVQLWSTNGDQVVHQRVESNDIVEGVEKQMEEALASPFDFGRIFTSSFGLSDLVAA